MEFPEQQAKKVSVAIDWWKAEKKGDQVVGQLVDSWEGENGTVFVLDNGEKRIGLPSHGFLVTGMKQVPLRSIVRVTYTGEGKAKPGQNAPKLYDVEYADV